MGVETKSRKRQNSDSGEIFSAGTICFLDILKNDRGLTFLRLIFNSQ